MAGVLDLDPPDTVPVVPNMTIDLPSGPLAAYLVHLTGRKVHVITVNDYLAKRDSEWMGPVYEALGLTVGAIQPEDLQRALDESKS